MDVFYRILPAHLASRYLASRFCTSRGRIMAPIPYAAYCALGPWLSATLSERQNLAWLFQVI